VEQQQLLLKGAMKKLSKRDSSKLSIASCTTLFCDVGLFQFSVDFWVLDDLFHFFVM
jgi:hypothetical protein